MELLNNIDFQTTINSPDIAEKRDWGYYLGYFRKGTDENGKHNCMIVEMRQTGNITTRKFAGGVNFDAKYTWDKREEYEYKYPKNNI